MAKCKKFSNCNKQTAGSVGSVGSVADDVDAQRRAAFIKEMAERDAAATASQDSGDHGEQERAAAAAADDTCLDFDSIGDRPALQIGPNWFCYKDLIDIIESVIPNVQRNIAFDNHTAQVSPIYDHIWKKKGIMNWYNGENFPIIDRQRIFNFIAEHNDEHNNGDVLTYWFRNDDGDKSGSRGEVVPVADRLIYRTNGTSYPAPRNTPSINPRPARAASAAGGGGRGRRTRRNRRLHKTKRKQSHRRKTKVHRKLKKKTRHR